MSSKGEEELDERFKKMSDEELEEFCQREEDAKVGSLMTVEAWEEAYIRAYMRAISRMVRSEEGAKALARCLLRLRIKEGESDD